MEDSEDEGGDQNEFSGIVSGMGHTEAANQKENVG